MFHHVVLIKFKAPLDARGRAFIEGECETLRKSIPGLRTLQFVENVADRSRGYTHAFESTFDDAAAHDLYQAHESHKPLKQFLGELGVEVVVLDHDF